MDDDVYYGWGQIIDVADLSAPFLKRLASAVERFPFTKLLEARRQAETEALVVEYQVERPRQAPVPIGYHERLLVLQKSAGEEPTVLALRKDFPDTAHQNLTPHGEPNSLCLFDTPFAEVCAGLTPMLLLQRIGNWLARAAVETLHADDQPLEPLLPCRNRIIFDPRIFESRADQTPVLVLEPLAINAINPIIVRAVPPEALNKRLPSELHFVVLPVTASPWHAQSIRHLPQNLEQLVRILHDIGVDLEAKLREFIQRLDASQDFVKYQSHRTVVLLCIPKTRTVGGEPESRDWWSFMLLTKLADLAVRLGIAERHEGKLGRLLGTPTSNGLDKEQISVLRPTFALSRGFAQALAGVSITTSGIVAIGAGALGSHVILGLARQGIGRWAIVDDDSLLPHNHERHALSNRYEGQCKSEALAIEIQTLLNDSEAAKGFPVSFLQHRQALPEVLVNELKVADLLLDLSASRAVTRDLAQAEYQGRRLAAFLSPDGRFLAVLSEGRQREVRLDDLEMQLAIAFHEMAGLSKFNSGVVGTVPYASSCRDLSAQLPYELVALPAAIAVRYIKSALGADNSDIRVWEWTESGDVIQHAVPVQSVRIIEMDGWTLRISAPVERQLCMYRQERLPNETGGVLLGRFDYEKRIIYIVSALPSPPDSVEWPTLYIRGCSGLQQAVTTIARDTGYDVSYVGEWHSHPAGYDATPSNADRQAHAWLVEQMGRDGLPGLVAIQGEEVPPTFLVGQA